MKSKKISVSQETDAGQAVYTKRNLRFYDFVVHGVSNRLIWRVPTRRLEELFKQHVTPNHLDVGVGTGMLLDHCKFPVQPGGKKPRVALMDLNQAALDFAAQRIGRWNPETIRCNVLEPIPPIPKFDSVSMNYLLHCLPGTMKSKCIVFDHLNPLMNAGATVFGATLLGDESVRRSWLARRLMAVYNYQGIFSNHTDTAKDLTKELRSRFDNVQVETVGCAALFSACKS